MLKIQQQMTLLQYDIILADLQLSNAPFHAIFVQNFYLNNDLFLSRSYVGNLKERSLKDQLAKDPTEVIRKAVLRMLPRNKLRDVSATTIYFSLSHN